MSICQVGAIVVYSSYRVESLTLCWTFLMLLAKAVFLLKELFMYFLCTWLVRLFC